MKPAVRAGGRLTLAEVTKDAITLRHTIIPKLLPHAQPVFRSCFARKRWHNL